VRHHDGQLREETAYVVQRDGVLNAARNSRTRDSDVHADRNTELGALGVYGVIDRVVVSQLRLQRQHPGEHEAVIAHDRLQGTRGREALARIDHERAGEPFGIRLRRLDHPRQVVGTAIARAEDRPLHPGGVHLVHELIEGSAAPATLFQAGEKLGDDGVHLRGGEVRVDPGIDHRESGSHYATN
jgi:hypothetical protein